MKFPKGELFPSPGQRPVCRSRSIKITTLKGMNTCIFIPQPYFPFVAKSQIGELAISNKFIQNLCVYYSSIIDFEILVLKKSNGIKSKV